MSTHWLKNAASLEARLQQALKRTPPRGADALKRWRAARDGEAGGSSLESLAAADSAASLERILGRNDLVDALYFQAMERAAKAVCRVVVGDERGTGWLLNQRLLITNNHVLPTPAAARSARVEFGVDTASVAAGASGRNSMASQTDEARCGLYFA
jgi:hypothetical protein